MNDSSLTKRQLYLKQYYEKNKERIAQRNKENYQKRRATTQGLKQHRKQCSEATKRYRERHQKRVKESRKQTYINRRERAFQIIGSTKCERCGCDEIQFLEINHKNGGGCKEYSQLGNKLIAQILRGERTIEDLEVLCRICNSLDYLERKDPDSAKRFKISWTAKSS